MDPQIISSVATLAVSVGTERYSHKKRLEMAEQKAELEKDLIDKREEARARRHENIGAYQDQDQTAQGGPQPATTQNQMGFSGSFSEDLDTIKGGFDCSICTSLLGELRNEPIDRQKRGVSELAQLKRKMTEDPSEAEIRQMMEGFEVLPDVALRA